MHPQAKGGQVQGSWSYPLCVCRAYVRSMSSVSDFLQLTKPRTDDIMKSSALVADTLIDPATSHSEDSLGSPCLRLFKTNYYDYLYAPGNEYRSNRFHVAMANLASSESSTSVPGGFPWDTLAEGTKIVDVGGGIGSACHEIMKTNPLLKFVVQDLPSVADQATTVST